MITGEDLRPDKVICDSSGKWYVLKLTRCHETNISKNISRKAQKYDQLMRALSARNIVFINLVISSVGMIAKESKSLIDILKKLGLNDNEITATVRKLINITIHSAYVIFCKWDSEWPSSDLLTFLICNSHSTKLAFRVNSYLPLKVIVVCRRYFMKYFIIILLVHFVSFNK